MTQRYESVAIEMAEADGSEELGFSAPDNNSNNGDNGTHVAELKAIIPEPMASSRSSKLLYIIAAFALISLGFVGGFWNHGTGFGQSGSGSLAHNSQNS